MIFNLNPATGGWDGHVTRFFFFVMVAHVLVLTWLFVCAYFGRNRWDMNYWAYTFAFDVVAVAVWLHYDRYIDNTFTHVRTHSRASSVTECYRC